MFTKAGQPEILRAAQRDEAFQKQLNDLFSELIRGGLGIHLWIRYREVSKILSNILYQAITTLSNLQTLGEEYTGMVQIGSSGKSLPAKSAQLLMIILNTCGEKLVIESLRHFENHIKRLPNDHPLRHEARIKLIEASSTLRESIPLIQRIHKAIFYLNGNYYHLSKRLTGIRYALIRYWLRDRSSLPTFRLLGLISTFHLILHTLLVLLNLRRRKIQMGEYDSSVEKSNEAVDSRDKCSLCLNLRQNTAATSCGHLFCWDCIIPWLQEQPQCPLCRQQVQPSRVIFLQNYS